MYFFGKIEENLWIGGKLFILEGSIEMERQKKPHPAEEKTG